MNKINTDIPAHSLPLVAAQPGIWMADKLSSRPAIWSVAHCIELIGAINEQQLSQAIIMGMSEADTLKMRYGEHNGIPYQWVDEQCQFNLPYLLDFRNEADPPASAKQWMEADRQQDLRLNNHQPLYQHCLMRINEQHWLWYQRYHHLIVDGFSFIAITRRIAEIYSALCQKRALTASPFIPFSEVVDEYQRYENSDACHQDKAFWQNRMNHMPSAITLSDTPLNMAEPVLPPLRLTVELNAANFLKLTTAQQAFGLSGADTLLALVSLWLARVGNQQSFSAGFVFMRRMGSSALCASGPVLNVLPYEVHINTNMTFTQLNRDLSKQMKLLRRHQRYDSVQIQRDQGLNEYKSPFYNVVVNLKFFDYRLNFNGVQGKTHHLASGPVHDLEIALYLDEQQTPAIEILACAERYNLPQLTQHTRRINLLINQLAADPDLRCYQADILHAHEKDLLIKLNNTARQLPATTLSDMIARQAQLTPDAIALADDSHQFSYQAMRQQVISLALALRQSGVQPGDIVAVALPRSVFLSLALQAILETGCAWLPLDTSYPDKRLSIMIKDARPRILITSADQRDRFNDLALSVFCYNNYLPSASPLSLSLSKPEHTAYVIYTSGSTGKPKGVMINQKAIINRLRWMQDKYPLQSHDVVLQKTPCSFDVSVWEFFWPLITGAKLVMAPPEAHRDPLILQQLIARWKITTIHFVPSMLAVFVSTLKNTQDITDCQSLQRVFCSGEALPVALCHQWQNIMAIPLYNLYGPTEAAVDVSWYPAYGNTLASISGSNVPIGWPIWNTGLHVLDSGLRPLPPGVVGELYLSGIQLAQGYLARPDLTASRFIASPFASGERMYRTGDIARVLDNGAIEYLGRTDDQLKLRGQRIELADITDSLQKLDGVANAAVNACLLHNDTAAIGDTRQLVGYLVPLPGATLNIEKLQNQLKEILPPHMLPAALMIVDELPLTINGKLDRKALPLPKINNHHTRNKPLKPGIETIIAAAFSRLLNCEIIDAEQDFFALGGHSLLAMQLAAELQQTLGRTINVGQIMVTSTVTGLAQALSENHSSDKINNAGFESILPIRPGNGPILFCIHPASGFAWQFSVLQRYLDPRWSIIGIQSVGSDGPMQQAANLDQVVDHHLRTLRQLQKQGSWHLLGYSLGGTLAQSIAARLQNEGEQVAFLGLLDTWPPEMQNWSKKDPDQLDPQVLKEIKREREAFLSAHQGASSDRLFNIIEGNYVNAVRLLATSHSNLFNGTATLFSAAQTIPAGITPEQVWHQWISQIKMYTLNCSHVDIISPEQLRIIGPIINRILNGED